MAVLELVRGMCGICLIMEGIRKAHKHTLDDCRRKEKYGFFEAKKKAQGRKGG